LSLLPPLHQSPLSRWCFACADWQVHSPRNALPGASPSGSGCPSSAALCEEQLPSLHLAGCQRRKASSCLGDAAGTGGGRCQQAVPKLQCSLHIAAESSNVPLLDCPAFPCTSPRLGRYLSPQIPLDYAANPQPRQSGIMLHLVFLPLELVASAHLELAGKVNSLRMCSRSVTACDGSHTTPGLTFPRGRSILASQCTCSCHSHTARGLANWSPLSTQKGSPARTRC